MLCTASRTFDPSLGYLFGTWATTLIKIHLFNVVRLHRRVGNYGNREARNRTVVSKHLRHGGSQSPDVIKPLLQGKGWSSSPTGWDCFLAVHACEGQETSLNQSVNHDTWDSLQDNVEDVTQRVDRECWEQQRDIQALLFPVLKKLKPIQKDIAISRVLAEEPETLQEIGDRWGFCRERIRQIEEYVMRLLTKALSDWCGKSQNDL